MTDHINDAEEFQGRGRIPFSALPPEAWAKLSPEALRACKSSVSPEAWAKLPGAQAALDASEGTPQP